MDDNLVRDLACDGGLEGLRGFFGLLLRFFVQAGAVALACLLISVSVLAGLNWMFGSTVMVDWRPFVFWTVGILFVISGIVHFITTEMERLHRQQI